MAARKKGPRKKAATSRKKGSSSRRGASTSKVSTSKAAKSKPAKGAAKGKGSASKARGRGNVGGWMVGLGAVGLLVIAGALAFGQSGGDRSDDPSGDHDNTEDVDLVDTTELVRPGAPVVPVAYEARVVTRYRHDDSAFTQGLLWHQGELYESTGLVGRSSIRRWNVETGRIAQRAEVPDVFAEGLALVGEELFQLTWQDGVLLIYDRETLEKKREIEYEGEGWGLCFDGEHLVMSDGSDQLTFRNPQTFAVERRVRVRKVGRPLRMLNELECVDGSVWANVWQRNDIVKIDPTNGNVTATLDASDLLTFAERRDADVLNGIAWLPERERFVITGKLWPAAFEIELVER